MADESSNLIHRRVEMARRGENPYVTCRMPSGWRRTTPGPGAGSLSTIPASHGGMAADRARLDARNKSADTSVAVLEETTMNRLPTLLGLAAAATALALPVAVGVPAAAEGAKQCLYVNQLGATKADGLRTIYARVGARDLWRIDLAADCAFLGDGKLVITPRGSGSICGPQDFDLGVSAAGGSQRCFVRSLTRLTPEEAAAVPKRAQP